MSTPESVQRTAMKTIGGMSVRSEIDARLAANWRTAHQQGIEDALSFLEASGHGKAAADLREALSEAIQRESAAA